MAAQESIDRIVSCLQDAFSDKEGLRRLLRALEENGPQPTALDAEVRDLVQRLQ